MSGRFLVRGRLSKPELYCMFCRFENRVVFCLLFRKLFCSGFYCLVFFLLFVAALSNVCENDKEKTQTQIQNNSAITTSNKINYNEQKQLRHNSETTPNNLKTTTNNKTQVQTTTHNYKQLQEQLPNNSNTLSKQLQNKR